MTKKKLLKTFKKSLGLFLALSFLGGSVPILYAANSFVVCIDPGHQAKGDGKTEPIAPGSGNRKARVSSGTSGVATKNPEYKINLEAGLILKELLESKGYKVVMTRTTNDVNISNAERAQLANEARADMTIRLHCDSINNGGKSGSVLLVPSQKGTYTSKIYKASFHYATCLKKALQNKGIKVNGIFERSDMTGFNWSQVPVVIFEMGFMSNWQEDRMLSDKNYQKKLMEAVLEALETYKTEITPPPHSLTN
ncbi:N-acetylmuramoyl-L-alanine amidase [Sporanaerobium hydrogeniformans]|uniref:N-acetylmuramoyl-L-alanine amidase n=1 Tax=Sporanaerobium hydrogeniformans TaxID=3072179 RepID=A0AC61D7J3_9FIRM|nr:N-acetylmuramoyl-L-alanine amidase [Sporanaerobium hydrogeniformans]PHV69504.1 N-acetylmuramoyl-L-alanine amidase [Sporanaerobium hydrogeniformans]